QNCNGLTDDCVSHQSNSSHKFYKHIKREEYKGSEHGEWLPYNASDEQFYLTYFFILPDVFFLVTTSNIIS
ncbi:MAG: hypothetical protein AAGJ18_02345, partial [Bacteroidota bacterium]